MNNDLKTREAAAIAAALLLARLAPLRFERDPDLPTLLFGNHLITSSANLLLVPSIEPVGSDNAAISAATKQTGCDALVVRAAGCGAADISFDVALAVMPDAWSTSLKLWLDEDGAVHLVPDAPRTTSYALTRFGLNASSANPWMTHGDREAGLERGRRELARVPEGR